MSLLDRMQTQRQQIQKAGGIIDLTKIRDIEALRQNLRESYIYEPQEGMLKLTNPEPTSKTSIPIVPKTIWEQKISHGGAGEPYEYLLYSAIPEQHAKDVEACKKAGFAKNVEQPDGFTYRLIVGGLMRRQTK